MKKIKLILIFLFVIFGCSACSVNLTINKDGNSERKVEIVEEETEPDKIPEKRFSEGVTDINASSIGEPESFYGVWCGGSKTKADAESLTLKLKNMGFDAQTFITTDWENLNTEKFYVVTAGVCETKQEAEQLLGKVKENGYSDAYVKYTGNRRNSYVENN